MFGYELKDQVRNLVSLFVQCGGRRGRVAQTESGIIWSDQMIFCREQGNEHVKLTRRRREAMKEHDGWGALRAGFSVENPDAVDKHAMIGRRSVGRWKWLGLYGACEKGCGKNVVCYPVHYDVPFATTSCRKYPVREAC